MDIFLEFFHGLHHCGSLAPTTIVRVNFDHRRHLTVYQHFCWFQPTTLFLRHSKLCESREGRAKCYDDDRKRRILVHSNSEINQDMKLPKHHESGWVSNHRWRRIPNQTLSADSNQLSCPAISWW